MNEELIALYAEDAVIDDDVVLGDSGKEPDEQEKKNTISAYYDSGKQGDGANILKFWLMPFVCFTAFGFPFGAIGNLVSLLSGFAAPAFFILSGFFILGGDREVRLEKLKRAIKRSGLCFLGMFVVFFATNVIYLSVQGVDWIPEVFRLRVGFNFFVFCIWPFQMGQNIWFIQSMFFACIILFLLDKIRFLRIYKLLLLLLAVFMLLSGEFAGVFNFHILDYVYIPGNTVTRALPYLLLGMLIREKAESLLQLRVWKYLIFAVGGLGLAHLEMTLLFQTQTLVYTGHTIGFGITAAALCCMALTFPKTMRSFTAIHGRSFARCIYILIHPVGFALILTAAAIGAGVVTVVNEYLGVIVYIVCFVLAFLFDTLRMIHKRRGKEDSAYMDEIIDAM